MKIFIKNNKYFISGFLILAWVIFANLFPKGYVFGGGDTTQFINLQENYRRLFYDWNGSAAFFYFIFYLLDLIGISNHIQLSFNLGLIIFGAYISFRIFAQLLFKNTSDLLKTFSSLFYALNLYTLFLFTGNWGYSYFPSLYIFIPLLTGLFLKFLETRKFYYGAWFSLAVFLASSGFGNPAFFISFLIFLALIFTFLVILKIVNLDKKIILNILFLGILIILVSTFWILPLLPQMKSGVEGIASSEVLDFNWTIRNTASPIWNTISLIHFSQDNFPYNFYYKNLESLKNVFIVLSFLPIIVIFWGVVIYKKFKVANRRYFLASLGLMLVMIMLIARVTLPFEIINCYFYNLWGMNTLRGFDKTAIYFPFILALLLIIIFSEIKKEKLKTGLMIIILLIPLPFYLGKLQRTVGYRVNSQKTYETASMSFLIKIPEEYFNIKNILNNDKKKSQIAILPATRNDGSGIVSYPKWKLYGADITQWLYKKSLIYQNTNYFSDWNFPEEFGNTDRNSDWLVKTLGMMNSRYIIYHKDAPEDSVMKTEYKMRILEEEGLIKNLKENDYFILYEIPDDYFIPYISWQKENIEIQPNTRSVENNFEKIRNSTAPADFREINPKKFEVDAKNIDNNIILSEKYNPLWKAYYITNSEKEIEIKDRFVARGYANGWKLDNQKNIKQILIEYYPTRLMWRGIWISGITVLLLIIYLLKYHYVHKKRTI